ncbi:MAG: TonB-dependent receptor [Pseudomonadota bacterium]
MKWSSGRIVALLALAVSAQGWAQDDSVIEEVIVTAQKREQSITEVPISIVLMTGDKIVEQGFNTLEDVLTFVPGAIIEQGQRGYDGTATMRGISQNGLNTSFEQSVAVFNDGVYYGRPAQSVAGLYDLQRAEVLFGPQPVYFGQSAIAGLISYSSVRPDPGKFEGFGIAEFGDIGHRKVEGAVNIPLGENWAARVAAKVQEDDGWTTNSVTGEDASARESEAFRLSLAGDIGDRLSAYLKFESFDQESDGTNTDAIECNPAAAQVPPLALCVAVQMAGLGNYAYDDTIPRGGLLSAHTLPQAMAPIGNFDLTQLPQAQVEALGGDIDGTNALLELEFELTDGVLLSSLTGYSEYDSVAVEDFDGTPFASLQFPNTEGYEQFSQELRVQSTDDGALQWMAGLYWQDQELEFSTDIISALPNPMGPSGTNATQYGEDAEYLAGFGAITYDINETWSIDIGARYQEVDKDAFLWEVDSFLTDAAGNRLSNTGPPTPTGTLATVIPNGTQAVGYSGIVPQLAPGDRCLGNTPNGDDCAAIFANGTPAQQAWLAAVGDTSLVRSDSELTPDIALRWNATDAGSYFLRYVEGFKGGGFSRASSSFIVPTKGAYEPETAKSIEAGGRLSFLDNRLRWNFTFYSTQYDDQQVSAQLIDPATGVSFFVFGNAAESTIQGLETTLNYVADNGFYANLGLAINDTEYDSFDGAQCIFSEIVTGDCRPDGTLDLSGTEFDGLPDWTGVIGLGYDNAITNRFGIRLSLDGSLYDDWDNTRPTQQTFQDHRSQDSFSVWNVRAALYSLDETWEVALWGRNVTDELYWLRQPQGIGVFGFDIANVSRPSTYGITFRYNFGN